MMDILGSTLLGALSPLKNSGSHIDASLSRQPLVKGERLVRYEVNAVMLQPQGRAQRASAKECEAMFVHGDRPVTAVAETSRRKRRGLEPAPRRPSGASLRKGQ